jgi:hypothetical protein
VLEVVKNKQQFATVQRVPESIDERRRAVIANTECPRDRRDDTVRIGHRSQIDEHCAVGECLAELVGDGER